MISEPFSSPRLTTHTVIQTITTIYIHIWFSFPRVANRSIWIAQDKRLLSHIAPVTHQYFHHERTAPVEPPTPPLLPKNSLHIPNMSTSSFEPPLLRSRLCKQNCRRKNFSLVHFSSFFRGHCPILNRAGEAMYRLTTAWAYVWRVPCVGGIIHSTTLIWGGETAGIVSECDRKCRLFATENYYTGKCRVQKLVT